MDTSVNIWDRQPQEVEAAWAAFRRYRDTPSPRPPVGVFAGEIGYSSTHVLNWAKLWAWDSRILAWDQHLDGKGQKVAESGVEEMARRHIELAKKGLGIVDMAMERLRISLLVENGGTLKAQEMARVLDVCAKLERLSRGEATERVEGKDYSALSDSDLEALAEISKKVK